ncbi:MAG: hypothetical protein DMF67_11345 [Acidobacteria bacterium]|nr:MAG: hypothetical protein DMF67_11345 [Acidobacteriota bacterium]
MKNKRSAAAFLPVLAFALALVWCGVAAAQEGGPPRKEGRASEINYEVQLHLLVASEGAEGATKGAAKVPQALDGLVRQLKASLPPADYRLAATFIYRVRDGGKLEVRTVGGSPFAPPQPLSLTPTFFQFTLDGVKLADDSSGENLVTVREFRLGLKVPIQTTTVSGDKAGQSYPVIQYEDTGIYTQIGVREGEPTLVGTLNTINPGQLFVLVITIKRVGR